MASATNHSMFEALFDRRLRPEGAFAAELREAGYDQTRAVQRYPTEVWTRCLEIARRHRWPDAPRPEAYRQLGREFTLGYLETPVGRLVGVALPLMSPRSLLERFASYLRLGREDANLTFELVEVTCAGARAVVHNPAAVPGTFVAGMIEVAFERMGRQGRVEIAQQTPTDYELRARWEPAAR